MTLFGAKKSLVIAIVMLSFASTAAAQEDAGRAALTKIYNKRTDLQALFRASDWKAIASPKTKGLPDLETWARTYGYNEHLELAVLFNPAATTISALPVTSTTSSTASAKPIVTLPPALKPIKTSLQPVQTIAGTFNFSTITAEKVLVIDPASRTFLIAKDVEELHPLASITKLMTAMIITDDPLSMSDRATVLAEDEVGGARLRVANGTPLTVRDIFYAMLVGSANNAAHALMRLRGDLLPSFVADMNAHAKTMGLASTTFADPSGLDLGNVSNAQDVAALALTAFENPLIRRAATTASYPLIVDGTTRHMKNTNELLTDPNNGLYVLGGKTGYLEESKWNLVVKMRDKRNQPLLIVTLGSASQPDSFKDSARLARWVWDHYEWK